jgi:hypothetical protein
VSITELERQLEAVRRESFAAGYAAAMKEVKELSTRRATAGVGGATVSSSNGRGRGRGRGRTRQAAPKPRSARRRRGPGTNGIAAGRARRPRRGTNAVLVSEVLKSVAPRALRQAEIRRALQDKGKTMSFPSIGYSLRQLVARKAARQVRNTWRFSRPS